MSTLDTNVSTSLAGLAGRGKPRNRTLRTIREKAIRPDAPFLEFSGQRRERAVDRDDLDPGHRRTDALARPLQIPRIEVVQNDAPGGAQSLGDRLGMPPKSRRGIDISPSRRRRKQVQHLVEQDRDVGIGPVHAHRKAIPSDARVETRVRRPRLCAFQRTARPAA